MGRVDVLGGWGGRPVVVKWNGDGGFGANIFFCLLLLMDRS